MRVKRGEIFIVNQKLNFMPRVTRAAVAQGSFRGICSCMRGNTRADLWLEVARDCGGAKRHVPLIYLFIYKQQPSSDNVQHVQKISP
jgi:hypothetical protein